MDAQSFVYWLNGFVELTNSSSVTDAQWKMIKEHLALVNKKVTSPLEDKSVLKEKYLQDFIDDMQKQKTFPTEYGTDTYPNYAPYPPIWLQGRPLHPLTPIC